MRLPPKTKFAKNGNFRHLALLKTSKSRASQGNQTSPCPFARVPSTAVRTSSTSVC